MEALPFSGERQRFCVLLAFFSMKPIQPQARREIVVISLISALALLPVLFLGLKSVFGSRPAQSFPTPPSPKPTVGRINLGGSYLPSQATLSPDARWIARMELSPSAIGKTTTSNSLSPAATEVVIYASPSSKEVFRDSTAGQFVGWVPGSNTFIIQNGLDLTLFSPSKRKPGAPAPTQPWASTLLSFPAGSDAIASEWGSDGSTALVFQTGAIALSPDFRFAVKAAWDKGDIWWRVADLMTGKIAPPVKAGRWLQYDPNVGGFSNDIAVSVAPASLTKGGLPLVTVIQKAVSLAPTPIPTPKPTYTPAQKQFVARVQQENREDERLRNMMMNPSAQQREEYFRGKADEFKRRFARDAERRRLFPPTPRDIWRMKHPDLNEAGAYQVDCFDLNTRKNLWTRWLRSDFAMPQTKFSPDGAALIAWNTARVVDENYGDFASIKDTGVEFLAPLTGKNRAQFRLYEKDFTIPKPEQAFFYFQTSGNGKFHSILVLEDSRSIPKLVSPLGRRSYMDSSEIPVLRLFDTSIAREVGRLDIDTQRFGANFEIENISTDDSGQFWLLGRGNYQFIPRSQLGHEFPAPLPRPTPVPTARAS